MPWTSNLSPRRTDNPGPTKGDSCLAINLAMSLEGLVLKVFLSPSELAAGYPYHPCFLPVPTGSWTWDSYIFLRMMYIGVGKGNERRNWGRFLWIWRWMSVLVHFLLLKQSSGGWLMYTANRLTQLIVKSLTVRLKVKQPGPGSGEVWWGCISSW